jgi:hypothetical protein
MYRLQQVLQENAFICVLEKFKTQQIGQRNVATKGIQNVIQNVFLYQGDQMSL